MNTPKKTIKSGLADVTSTQVSEAFKKGPEHSLNKDAVAYDEDFFNPSNPKDAGVVAYDKDFFDKAKDNSDEGLQVEIGQPVIEVSGTIKEKALALVNQLNDGSPLSEKKAKDKEVLIFDRQVEMGDYSKKMTVLGNELVSGLFSNSVEGRSNLNEHTESARARVSLYNDKLAISMIDSAQENIEDRTYIDKALARVIPMNKLNVPLSTLFAEVNLKTMGLKCRATKSLPEEFLGAGCYVFDGQDVKGFAGSLQDNDAENESFALASSDVIFIASNDVLQKILGGYIGGKSKDATMDYKKSILPVELKTLFNSCVRNRDEKSGTFEFDQQALFNKLSELQIRARMNEDQPGPIVSSYVAWQVP